MNHISFSQVIGDNVEERNYIQNYGEERINYIGTYVVKDGNRLKMLATPGIIRNDQPNEVIVELVEDGNSIEAVFLLYNILCRFMFRYC